MNVNDLAATVNRMQNELDKQGEEISQLKEWKKGCNTALACWGSVCMFTLSLGAALIHYYDDIKRILISFWGLK